jgi:hypothetical protein
MYKLHILDLYTHKMIIVECSDEDYTKTLRSFDPLRYKFCYSEDMNPIVPLVTFGQL